MSIDDIHRLQATLEGIKDELHRLHVELEALKYITKEPQKKVRYPDPRNTARR